MPKTSAESDGIMKQVFEIQPKILLADEYLRQCDRRHVPSTFEGMETYCQTHQYRLKWIIFWRVRRWWKPWTWMRG